MPASLGHVELYVSNLARSREFWAWFLAELGWESYQEFETGFSYTNGTSYIVFVQARLDYLAFGYHRQRVGLNHIAFTACDIAAVDNITEKLAEKGIFPLYPDRHPHAGGPAWYAVYFEDPDRIKIEYGCAMKD